MPRLMNRRSRPENSENPLDESSKAISKVSININTPLETGFSWFPVHKANTANKSRLTGMGPEEGGAWIYQK